MKVKGDDFESDNALWDKYMDALPDESQEMSGLRVSRDQSWFSRREGERRAGERLKLKERDRRAIRRAIDVLTSDSPEARARREAYAQAAQDAQALADRYRALATSSTSGGPGVRRDPLEDQQERGEPGPTNPNEGDEENDVA